MATKIERRRRLSKRKTRTHRKLKGVNIGQRYHDLLEGLADLHGDSANGSIRAQAEAAIVCYAQSQGIAIPVDMWPPWTSQATAQPAQNGTSPV